MAAEIYMPRLGDTMTEGKVVRWFKNPGDSVEKGEPLVSISAEKVDYEIEASEAGILRLILAKEEETVPVGSVIGVIGGADEDISQYEAGRVWGVARGREQVATIPDSQRQDEVQKEGRLAKKILISPAARKLSRSRNIDYSQIAGSGPKGRILRKDIEAFIASGEVREKAVPAAASREEPRIQQYVETAVEGKTPAQVWRFGDEYPMSEMRKVIARRMTTSSSTAPHIHFFTEVDMTKLNRLREEIADKYERDLGVRISINDILIKLTALTIKDYPLLNAKVENDRIIIPPEINICLAVALPDGLIVPSINSTDKKGLTQIAVIRKDLVERARIGRLKLSELESGTFTISSLSQFDIFYFTAILNPPQSGILTVGRSYEKPVVINKEIVIRSLAVFGLSVDHRIVDGAVAAAFLQSLKEKLEKPYFYLLG